MNKFLITISWAVVFIFAGCVEPLEIEITEEIQALVVEGKITDEPGPYTVRLSLSTPINDDTVLPVTGGTIKISEEGGESETLTQVNPGVYMTDENGIQGEVGKRYKIEISLSDGRQYESTWGLLKASPPIDSIHYRYEERATLSGTFRGIDLLVDTHDPTGESKYYRWDWEETWRYNVPFPARLEYLGNVVGVPLSVRKQYCYLSASSDKVSTATSVNNASDVITNQVLTYVTNKTSRLQLRYSVLVKQYVIEEEEFLFWKSLQEATENIGGLYDRQPESLTGNITNIANPNEPVLGYFSVSGVSEKRKFINPFDLPNGSRPDNALYRRCVADLDSIPLGPTADGEIFEKINRGAVFYDFYGVIGIQGFVLTDVPCSDCTFYGGTIDKPDFWID